MAPKKSSEANRSKRKSVKMTIVLKKELIAKHESSTHVSDLAAMFEMPKSTVCTILKNKEMIRAADMAKGVMTLTSKRSKFIEEVEKLLFVWINENQLVSDPISEGIICEKARLLYADLKKDVPLEVVLIVMRNPRVFKKNSVMKSKLNVMWRANMKALVARQFFTEWFHEEFAPSVKACLEEKNPPLKALLVMDNASAHPPVLEEDLKSSESDAEQAERDDERQEKKKATVPKEWEELEIASDSEPEGELLKSSAASASALALTDYDKPFHLYVSNRRTGYTAAVLMREAGGGRMMQPIAYYSIRLDELAQDYPPNEPRSEEPFVVTSPIAIQGKDDTYGTTSIIVLKLSYRNKLTLTLRFQEEFALKAVALE
ncbi:hypothetical protein chiPu_0010719 [Chiloscyllium punctatum]|uniref:DDE-1 domain-containing protein n=1 Tax=Chiloscyllium punctatum TaxID=137246 RepID=A0A401SPF5_CHIPU|nr:hypothetical protein [Chiloscyllium punctatum]